MKRIGLIMAMFASLFLVSSTALAQDTAPDWANKQGAIGIGFDTSMGGSNGLHVRTCFSRLACVSGSFGFQLISADVDPSETTDNDDFSLSTTRFDIGLSFAYALAFWQRGSLSALISGDIRTTSTSVDGFGDADSDDSATDFILGLGLQAEWFPTQYLSIFGQGGIRLDFLTNADGADIGQTADDISGIAVDLGADLLGQFGVTVWFQ